MPSDSKEFNSSDCYTRCVPDKMTDGQELDHNSNTRCQPQILYCTWYCTFWPYCALNLATGSFRLGEMNLLPTK